MLSFLGSVELPLGWLAIPAGDLVTGFEGHLAACTAHRTGCALADSADRSRHRRLARSSRSEAAPALRAQIRRLAAASRWRRSPRTPPDRSQGERAFATLDCMLHQRTLLGGGEPAIDEGAQFERVDLDDHSWVEVAREWMRGADSLLDVLIEQVEWKQGKRWMYERMVDDPRLSRWYPASENPPHPALLAAKRARTTLRRRVRKCRPELLPGRKRQVAGCDRELRELDDTRIAILTLGARRPF